MGNASHTRALEELQKRFHNQDAKLLELASANQNQIKEINELKKKIEIFETFLKSPPRRRAGDFAREGGYGKRASIVERFE